jgi:hypothetical protein
MHEYEVLRQQHVALFTRLIPLHVKRLSWSVEQLRIERRDRLRDLLRIALSSSSWHRQRLAGIDPDLFEEDDLQHIRPMTKDDLMAN